MKVIWEASDIAPGKYFTTHNARLFVAVNGPNSTYVLVDLASAMIAFEHKEAAGIATYLTTQQAVKSTS